MDDAYLQYDGAIGKVKVLLCGDSGVGKDRLIQEFTSRGQKRASTLNTVGMYKDHCDRRFVAIINLCGIRYCVYCVCAGIDVQHKTISVEDKSVKLQIW